MEADQPVKKADLPNLSPKFARLYAGAGPGTLSRDVNRLVQAGLIRRAPKGYLPNVGLMAAFMPPSADPPTSR